MCQTSVSCSIYSGFSNGSEHVGNFTSTARMHGPTVLPNQSEDSRNVFIHAAVSRLQEVEATLATLATQHGFIKELLQMAALMGIHQ